MAQQHVFTSAPQGLKPGTRGFTTVGASRELTPTLISRLELLSGYTLPAAKPDAKTKFNPVNFMHVKLTIGGEKHTLVSRIAPVGVDYTGRSNTLAHHLIVAKNEEPPAGPAWLAMQSGLLLTQWTGQPRQLPSIQLPPGHLVGKPCSTWTKVMGDASYAGSLVMPIISQPGRPIVLIHTPEQAPDIPAMLFEALAILPAQLRWDVTFSTYFTSAAPDVHCRVRCVLSTDPLADQVRRVASVVLLDLTQKTSGRPIPGEPYETCRKGGTWPDLAPASSASEETSDKVHPAAAKMLRAKPVPQMQELLLAELSDDPSGVHAPASVPPTDQLARNRAARKDDWATVKSMGLAAAVVIGSVAALTVGAFYLFSSTASTATAVDPLNEQPERPIPPRVVTPAPIPVDPTITAAAPRTAVTGPSTTPGGRLSIGSSVPTSSPPTPGPTAAVSSTGQAPVATGGSSSNVLAALNWSDVKFYDPLNSYYQKYTGSAADLPENLSQKLTYEGNTLVAKFPGPFPKAIAEATSFDVIVNLPSEPRGLQGTPLRSDPTVLEIRKPGTQLASEVVMAKFSIAKQKDNSFIKFMIEPGTIALSELTGSSILFQPSTGNFDGRPDDWRKSLLLATLPDPSGQGMTIDVPLFQANLDKPNPPINTYQAALFGRLSNWRLAPSAAAPGTRWSEYLLTVKRQPTANDFPPDAGFTAVIFQASNDIPQPQADVMVKTTDIKSLWEMRRDLGKRRAVADAARAKLKDTLERLNKQGEEEDKGYHRLSPNGMPADILKDLESDGKRGVSTVSSPLAMLLNSAKEDAKKAKDEEASFQQAAKAIAAITDGMTSAKYQGYDVFGNAAASVTFNIVKTGETTQPSSRMQAVTQPDPTAVSPPADGRAVP